jgi:2,5-furandicarboxylate decarboxylase 1
MEASKDIFTVPGARGHEYIRVSDGGIRTKLGIDATVPFAEKTRFARCEFKPVAIDNERLSTDPALARARLDL